MNEEYILVPFPEVQQYMGMKWFRQECYLCQAFSDQKHIDSAYFIPKNRVQECNDNLITLTKRSKYENNIII